MIRHTLRALSAGLVIALASTIPEIARAQGSEDDTGTIYDLQVIREIEASDELRAKLEGEAASHWERYKSAVVKLNEYNSDNAELDDLPDIIDQYGAAIESLEGIREKEPEIMELLWNQMDLLRGLVLSSIGNFLSEVNVSEGVDTETVQQLDLVLEEIAFEIEKEDTSSTWNDRYRTLFETAIQMRSVREKKVELSQMQEETLRQAVASLRNMQSDFYEAYLDRINEFSMVERMRDQYTILKGDFARVNELQHLKVALNELEIGRPSFMDGEFQPQPVSGQLLSQMLGKVMGTGENPEKVQKKEAPDLTQTIQHYANRHRNRSTEANQVAAGE